MNARLNKKTILRMAKEILGLAGLACLALACAAPTWAGTNQAAGNQAGAAVSQPQAPPATPQAPNSAATAKPAAAPSASAERPKGGNHEGITVHGHWVIEVKNPDGTVTARREFENSIQPYGMSFLASLLAGNNSSGGLSVLLNGIDATYQFEGFPFPFSLAFSDAGPCLPIMYNAGGAGQTINSGGPASGTTCLIATPTTPAGSAVTGSILGVECLKSQPAGTTFSTANCSTNLTVAAPTFITTTLNGVSGTAMQVQLSGSVTVTAKNPGNVTDVETVFTVCTANGAPSNCSNVSLPVTSGLNVAAINLFTLKKLDGANGDPTQVPYAPGQVIAVTVLISFQ